MSVKIVLFIDVSLFKPFCLSSSLEYFFITHLCFFNYSLQYFYSLNDVTICSVHQTGSHLLANRVRTAVNVPQNREWYALRSKNNIDLLYCPGIVCLYLSYRFVYKSKLWNNILHWIKRNFWVILHLHWIYFL